MFQELLPQVRRWQEGEAALREIKKHLQQDPRNTLAATFEVAEDCKLGWQMILLWRFGVDAETLTCLRGFKPPRSLVEAQHMILAGVLHTFWNRVLDARVEAYVALVAGREPYAAMEKKVLEAFEELPATFGVIVQAAQNDALKEWAATRLATWTDTQIKLGEDRARLNAPCPRLICRRNRRSYSNSCPRHLWRLPSGGRKSRSVLVVVERATSVEQRVF
jgi:hypothetical protein